MYISLSIASVHTWVCYFYNFTTLLVHMIIYVYFCGPHGRLAITNVSTACCYPR